MITTRYSVAITVSSNDQVPAAVSPSTVISGGPELVPQEPDDLVPPGELQRLAVHLGAVVHRGVRREHLRELVPQLQVDAAQVAVLHLADLFDRGKVHAHQLGPSD